MENTSLNNKLLDIATVILLLTLFRSILIMICGKNLFKKAKMNVESSNYPILNLFSFLELTQLPTSLGILFFIPLLNLIPLIISSYKLGKIFNVSSGMILGLIFLPFVFYPVLSKKNYSYYISDEKYRKRQETIKTDNLMLMTDDDIKKLNSVYEESNKVDSIFKSDVDLIEESTPYKARKNKKEEIENLDL